jgi:hypothetical protein
MIAVITGDIIASRKLVNQENWLNPLKKLFSSWGSRTKDWEIDRGDFFQIEVINPEDALKKAFEIKALIKKTPSLDEKNNISSLDIRMAIGIGDKTYFGESIKESNGTAFIYAGEKFDTLKKENINIGIKSQWKDFDEEMNLYLKLTETFMNKWSFSSAELVEIVLKNPKATQVEIGKQLGIEQNSVSGRWNRAKVSELLEVEKIFRKKINILIK